MAEHRPFSELRARMSPERRARNAAQTQIMLKEMSLAELRESNDMTHAQIAINQATPPAKPKRIVTAPVSSAFNSASSVLSVELSEDEEVQWQWTHLPNGESLVTGYEIIKKKEPESLFNIKEAVSDWLRGS